MKRIFLPAAFLLSWVLTGLLAQQAFLASEWRLVSKQLTDELLSQNEELRRSSKYNSTVYTWTTVAAHGSLPLLEKVYSVVPQSGEYARYQRSPWLYIRGLSCVDQDQNSSFQIVFYDFTNAEKFLEFDDVDGLLEIPHQKVMFRGRYDEAKEKWVIGCIDPAKG